MKLLKNGKGTLAISIENITSFGLWMNVRGKEYFLSYKNYSFFLGKPIESIKNVKLLHGFHLYWPELDVDLEIDNLENPEKFPLRCKIP